MHSRRNVFLVALSLILALSLAVACSAEDASDGGRPQALGVPSGERDDRSDGASEELGSGEAPGIPGDATGGAPNPAKLQTSLDRKIVQSSSIDIEVHEVGRHFQDIVGLAETSGGFVVSSTFSNSDDGQIADITVRVPNDRYQSVLSQIRDMGDVQTENSTASDVTEEYTDLESRMRQLRAEERQYLELLGQAQNIEQVLLVQDRLNDVIAQIEQVQGRINLLDHLTDLATITAHIRPLAAGTGGGEGGSLDPIEAAENAWDASLDTLRGLAIVVVAVAAYSWWLVPLGIAGYAGGRWLTRRSRPPTGASA